MFLWYRIIKAQNSKAISASAGILLIIWAPMSIFLSNGLFGLKARNALASFLRWSSITLIDRITYLFFSLLQISDKRIVMKLSDITAPSLAWKFSVSASLRNSSCWASVWEFVSRAVAKPLMEVLSWFYELIVVIIFRKLSVNLCYI